MANGGSDGENSVSMSPYSTFVDLEPIFSSPLVEEPPTQLVVKYVDFFLKRFRNSGYFFLEPQQFRNRALLPLPFGHPDRLAPSLTNVIYLWGCILSSTDLSALEADFLSRALESLSADITGLNLHRKPVLETIQAEVMLSLYYLHAALPVQGRYHSAAAATMALNAGLHRLSVPIECRSLYFLSSQPLLSSELDVMKTAEGINAFWVVSIVNNYWVAAARCPSTIPHGLAIDIPWPSSSEGASYLESNDSFVTTSTITKFLNGHEGNEEEARSPAALLTKASILLERVTAYSWRNYPDFVSRRISVNIELGPPNSTTLQSLDKRLNTFQAVLPCPDGEQMLLMAHALTDLAIIHVHVSSTSISNTARQKSLAAANHIVSTLVMFNFAELTDPMLGPICAAAATVYMHEMSFVGPGGAFQASMQFHELGMRIGSVLNTMAMLAPRSPLMREYDSCVLLSIQ
ncbi:hypothetical protein C8R44DRAFT_895575 [Mycena epipterygia]|nr:hypothetical protein C8R44DRAFT_895575 [Mycena epipterygia]